LFFYKIDLKIDLKIINYNKSLSRKGIKYKMALNDYYASKITFDRLESTFKEGYLTVLNLIAKSPDFFNGEISGIELFNEFVKEPLEEIKSHEKEQKEIKQMQNMAVKKIKMASYQVLNRSKCHALIHIKRELRQCQSSQLPDDDFCTHHSKLDILPYGRVNFDYNNDDNDDNNDNDYNNDNDNEDE
jgi:hypothetical protein